MAAGIHETLLGSLRPGLLSATGTLLDEHDIGVRKGLEASFAAILGGLLHSAGDTKVMTQVADHVAAPDNDISALSDATALLRAGPQSANMALGNRLLASLFGDRQNGIVKAIARASGITQTSAAALFSMAAPMVLGILGRRTSTQGSTPGSLTALVAGETELIVTTVPPYLRPLVGMAPQENRGLLDGTLEGGLRSAMLLALPLLCVLGLFWYVLPPLQTSIAVKLPEKPVIDSRVEIHPGDWGRDLAEERGTERDTRTSEPSGSRTWTNPSNKTSDLTPVPAPAASAKAPPLSGLVRVTLPDGIDIDVVPFGLEQKVIGFAEDRYAYVDKMKWFDFDRLRFMSGSTDLTPGSKAQVKNVAKILKAYPNMRVKIGGYTDNVGNPESNLRLSDTRARNVMAAIIKLGVAPDRVEAEGYGELHPIAENSTPEGRAKNRRTATSVRQK